MGGTKKSASAAQKRRRLKTKRAPPRKKKRAPAPRKKQKSRARARAPKATRDWRSNPSSRNLIVGALKSIAGSLVGRLTRAPLSSDEVVYLRGIANLKLGKRLTYAQQLAVLAATRVGSPLFRSVFGKREEKLLDQFLKAQNARALSRTRTPGDMAKNFGKELSWGIAMQLADAHKTGKTVFYRKAGGATQVWSVESFRRFISNPAYKANGRRAAVLGGGTFWIARPSRSGGLPKKGKQKLIIT